jgi:hypothetical protein
MRPIEHQRVQVAAQVRNAYDRLSQLVGGDFSSGYYNKTAVINAEAESGFPVCDAVLGHVLWSPKDEATEKRAVEVLTRVEAAIDSSAVENMCHNLHAAVVGMLDLVGCPAIVIWGTVDATAPGLVGFTLPAYVKSFPEQRPGHSWILTPYHCVADLAIAHQFSAGGDYESIKQNLPRLVQSQSRESAEPQRAWFRFPEAPGRLIPEANFANETKYHNLLGWSLVETPACSLRYLPGAVTLPAEADLDDIAIAIGGRKAGRFFRDQCGDLVAGQ